MEPTYGMHPNTAVAGGLRRSPEAPAGEGPRMTGDCGPGMMLPKPSHWPSLWGSGHHPAREEHHAQPLHRRWHSPRPARMSAVERLPRGSLGEG